MSSVTVSDGVRIHFTEWGNHEGPTVLFIHGLGADNMGWFRQRHAFGRDYHCVAVDNRGSGGSDKPPGPYSLERMAHDAVAVLDQLELEAVHIVGASMGGALAQIIAVEHPERVLSLTLACTACEIGWREELFGEWENIIRTQGMRAFAMKNFEWLFGPRSVRRLWPVAALLGPVILRAPEESFVAQVGALRSFGEHSPHELGRITAPTLVVTGSQDILTPVADAEEIASRIPNSELVIVRGAAHGFMVEGARHFNRVVLDFLSRQREPAAA